MAIENDIIAAAATPLVKSAIGIVRISGPGAGEMLRTVFRPAARRGFHPRRLTFGSVYAARGLKIDEGLAVFMPAPASYTGEDTAEIYCHGSPGVVAALLEALYENGARPAQPGEFTRRAFLNGRMDLSQSEAVIDLIESETKAAAANAARQLSGALGARISAVRDDLIDVASHLFAVIDFPEEEVEDIETEELFRKLRESLDKIITLKDSYNRGAYIKNGVPCAIIGKPNVGKSSLLNALAGFERAIVTEIPGTTRDVVEHSVQAFGTKLTFADTAGLRKTKDVVERVGVRMAGQALQSAAAILAVFDGSQPPDADDFSVIERAAGREVWCVLNKSDLPRRFDVEIVKKRFNRIFSVSAKEGAGVSELLASLAEYFAPPGTEEESIVTNPRQADALSRAAEAIERAITALRELTADIVAADVETAAGILGEITGQTASEDIIERIFTRFCVGK